MVLNTLSSNNPLHIETVRFTASKTKVYIFNCEGYECPNKVRIQKQHLKTSTGKCKRCCQKGTPFRAKYNELVKTAKRRGTKLTLTFEEFLDFTKQTACHYCNKKLVWVPFTRDIKDNTVVSRQYMLDRKDNNLGYHKYNCVVCCGICNYAKGNRYSYEDWYGMTEFLRNKHK